MVNWLARCLDIKRGLQLDSLLDTRWGSMLLLYSSCKVLLLENLLVMVCNNN